MKRKLQNSENYKDNLNLEPEEIISLPASTEQRVANILLFAKCNILIDKLVKEKSNILN